MLLGLARIWATIFATDGTRQRYYPQYHEATVSQSLLSAMETDPLGREFVPIN